MPLIRDCVPIALATWLEGEAGTERRVEIVLHGGEFAVRIERKLRVAQGAAELRSALAAELPKGPVGNAVAALLLAQVAANMGPWT